MLGRILRYEPDMVVADHVLAILGAESGPGYEIAVVERKKGSSKDSSRSAFQLLFPNDSSPVLDPVLELAHTPAVPCPSVYPLASPYPSRHWVSSSSPEPVTASLKEVQSFPQIEPNEEHIAVDLAFAFAFAPAGDLNEALKPKVEVEDMGMDDLDLIGNHSCRPGGMVVEPAGGSRDRDMPEPVAA